MSSATAISPVFALHYVKLVFRSLLFVFFGALWIFDDLELLEDMTWLWTVIWLLLFGGILLRFFPSRLESGGAQKQMACTYIPKNREGVPPVQNTRALIVMLLVWLVPSAIIALLYFTGVIGNAFLLLLTSFLSVLDVICILFFCPFQTWILKNRCCTTCRIYNWDYVMMLTPAFFIPSVYTYTLFAAAVALFIQWEVSYARHPERFYSETNACLDCSHCEEKLCMHKRQLRSFWHKQKMQTLARSATAAQPARAEHETVADSERETVGAAASSGERSE